MEFNFCRLIYLYLSKIFQHFSILSVQQSLTGGLLRPFFFLLYFVTTVIFFLISEHFAAARFVVFINNNNWVLYSSQNGEILSLSLTTNTGCHQGGAIRYMWFLWETNPGLSASMYISLLFICGCDGEKLNMTNRPPTNLLFDLNLFIEAPGVHVLLHSGAPGAGERKAELLLLQVQPQTDVHQSAEGPAVGVPAASAADLHRLPADPPTEACHGAGQPPHPHPLPENRAQLPRRPLAKYWL